MSLVDFIRLLVGNIKLLLMVPLVLGSTVFMLTRNEKKSYTSSTTIYTGFASGYTIEGNNKADFFNTAMAFDNLLNITQARETRESVAIGLLARHLMLKEPDVKYISKKSFDEFQLLFPPEISSKLLDSLSYENTIANIVQYKEASDTNEVFNLLNSAHKFYSIKAVSSANVTRVGNSDLVKAVYSSEDQSICKLTLEILLEVFIEKFRKIKEDQTSTVVAYFMDQSDRAQSRLSNAEAALLNFRKKNNIINYYEQTRFISSEKEKLDKEVNDELIELAAAQASMNSLNNKLGKREQLMLNSKEIISKRDQLANLSASIALKEISNPDSSHFQYNNKDLSGLKNQARSLKGDIQSLVESLYTSTNSVEGLPIKDLLERWVNSAIVIDESQARMKVLEARQNDFENIYKRMAPLGAEIKKIEREISVSEQEYLALLQSLNQSKLKQQNVELTSDLKVVDAPFYPTDAKTSPRMIMVIVSGFGGMVFTIGIIIAIEFMDSTLKYPIRAEEQTGLPLAGAFPKFLESSKKVDINYVNQRLIEQIVQDIKRSVNLIENQPQPHVVGFFSNRKHEGKSMLMQMVVKLLRNLKYKIVVFNPADEAISIDGQDQFTYEVNNDFFELQSIDQLFFHVDEQPHSYDLIFIELPPLLHNQYPIEFVKKIDLSYMIVRANRKWNKADQTSLSTFESIVNHKPKLIINGVKVETLETIIGEIPKKRGWLRKTVKRWAKFEFRSRNNF